MKRLPGPDVSDAEFHAALARLDEETAARLLLVSKSRRESRVQDALSFYLGSKNSLARAYAAAGCPIEDVLFLVHDADPPARRALASRVDLPEAAAVLLASDSDADVLNRLATNPNLPAAAQILLAGGGENPASDFFFYGKPILAAFLVGLGRPPGAAQSWAQTHVEPGLSHHEVLEALSLVPSDLRGMAEAGAKAYLGD